MLKIRAAGTALAVSQGVLRIRGARAAAVVTDPLAAFIADVRAAAPNAGGLFLADPPYYTASLTQAGVFSDAFGGPRTYTAPNVQASPTAVQDPATGLWYVSADGADDTAVGNASETVAAYTFVGRSPQTVWNNYGSPLGQISGDYTNQGLGWMRGGGYTSWDIASGGSPRRARKNGAELVQGGSPPTFELAPITDWAVHTAFCRTSSLSFSQVLQMFCMAQNFYLRLHRTALLTWPTDPNASEVQAAEAAFTRRYGPLLATNP